jgi:hypothetical protein
MLYAIKENDFFSVRKISVHLQLFLVHLLKTCILNHLLLDFSLRFMLPYQYRKNCSFVDYIDVLICVDVCPT